MLSIDNQNKFPDFSYNGLKNSKSLPTVKWAQRKDRLFLTVELRDIKNEKIDLKPESLKFSGVSDNQLYELEITFFDEINVEESKQNFSGLHLQFLLMKKEEKEYWVRLTKEQKKYQHIQVDWDKYVDEDDEAEEGSKGLEDWDQNKFQDFQGQGQDEGDEDDEDAGGNLDDLDKEEQVPQQEEKDQLQEEIEEKKE